MRATASLPLSLLLLILLPLHRQRERETELNETRSFSSGRFKVIARIRVVDQREIPER